MKYIFSFFLLLLAGILPAQTIYVTAKGDTVVTYQRTKTLAVLYDSVYLVKTPAQKTTTVSYDSTVIRKLGTVPPPVVPDPGTGTGTTQTFIVSGYKVPSWPGTGVEAWHGQRLVSGVTGPDRYARASATIIEPSKGVYNWAFIDDEVRAAGTGKFSFGFMTFYGDGENERGQVFYNGAYTSIPGYVIDQMLQEPVKPFKVKGDNETYYWCPNWNSPAYLAWLLAFNTAVNNHIDAMGWHDRIGCVDMRGYGNWGEWHSYGIVASMSNYPSGTRPTLATFKAILDIHVKAYPNQQLVMMAATLDRNQLGNTLVPPEVADYALALTNQRGRIGLRTDHVGYNKNVDSYADQYMQNSKNQWMFAPITGEPPGGPDDGNYSTFAAQVTEYHMASFGNGNYGSPVPTAQVQSAAANMGYRLALLSGTVVVTSTVSINTSWASAGNVPMYEPTTLTYELRSGSTVVARQVSRWTPRLLIGNGTASDTGLFAGQSGTFDLWAVLTITGRPTLAEIKLATFKK